MSSSGAAYGNVLLLPLAEETLAASAASPTSPSFAAPSAASITLLVLKSLRSGFSIQHSSSRNQCRDIRRTTRATLAVFASPMAEGCHRSRLLQASKQAMHDAYEQLMLLAFAQLNGRLRSAGRDLERLLTVIGDRGRRAPDLPAHLWTTPMLCSSRSPRAMSNAIRLPFRSHLRMVQSISDAMIQSCGAHAQPASVVQQHQRAYATVLDPRTDCPSLPCCNECST